MKTAKKFHTRFEMASSRTPEEIKAVCSQLQTSATTDYDIRSNGNHIWVELGKKKQQYWSPMLHLRLENTENQTYIKGEFAENPLLWIVFLITQIASISVFLLSLVVSYFKHKADLNFNAELFTMFGMVSVWFTLHLISENYKRKGKRQIDALHDFVDQIASA